MTAARRSHAAPKVAAVATGGSIMRGIIQAGIVLASLLSVAACQRTDSAQPTAASVAEAGSTAADDADATPARARDAVGGTAREQAVAAMRDGRIYTPAGDSAIDHWL